MGGPLRAMLLIALLPYASARYGGGTRVWGELQCRDELQYWTEDGMHLEGELQCC